MRLVRNLGGACLLLSVVGCASTDNGFVGKNGVIRDRSKDYQAAQALPGLRVPTNLDDSRLRDTMEIPDIGQAATREEEEFEAPRPNLFYLEAGSDAVNLERQDNQRVILVDEPRDEVWVKVQDYWQFNEVSLVLISPAEGVMETDWIVQGGDGSGLFKRMVRRLTFQPIDGPTRDKMRLSVTPERDGRTGIRLKHLRVADAKADEPLNWKHEAQDISKDSEVIYDLLHFLSRASTPATARALKLQEAKQAERVTPQFGRDSQGNPMLRLSTDVDHAWSLIDEALANAEIDVGSANRELGKYYVTYVTQLPVEEKPGGVAGFFRWLHSDRDDIKISSAIIDTAMGRDSKQDPKDKVQYSSQVEPEADPEDLSQKEGHKILLGDRVVYVFESKKSPVRTNVDTGRLEHVGRYQVKLQRRNAGVFVTILTDSARPAPPLVAEELLWKLKERFPSG